MSLHADWKSAFSDAHAPGVGPRRRKRTTSRSAQAFTPIEIGLLRCCAPGVGLRRRKRRLSGRRRPTVGRRPPEVEFIRRAGRPLAEGLWRPNSFGAPRARRRPPPTQRALFRSAQADRRPEAPQGRIHSTGRPTVGRRPLEAEFIRRAGRPSAEGRPRPNSSGAFRRPPSQAPHGAAL